MILKIQCIIMNHQHQYRGLIQSKIMIGVMKKDILEPKHMQELNQDPLVTVEEREMEMILNHLENK